MLESCAVGGNDFSEMVGKKRTNAPVNLGRGHQDKKRKANGVVKRQDIDFPADEEEQDVEVSDEDMEFVRQYGEDKINFLTSLDKSVLDRSVKQRQSKDSHNVEKGDKVGKDKSGSDDDDEEAGVRGARTRVEKDEAEAAYELEPRRVDKDSHRTAGSRGLPVKTLDGQVMYQHPKQRQQLRGSSTAHGDDEEAVESGVLGASSSVAAVAGVLQVAGVTIEDDMELSRKAEAVAAKQAAAQAAQANREQKAEELRRREEEQEAAAGGLPRELASSLKGLLDQSQRRQALKEAMAVAAQKLLSGPEDHVSELKILLALANNQDSQVSRLALLSLLAVFRDIIPGYRIRPPTDQELQVKVSKEVQKLRDYEAALLRSYQTYLKILVSALNKDAGGSASKHGAKKSGPGAAGSSASKNHARIAIKCMCQLLSSIPHFNYTSDLLQAVVPRMTARDQEIRVLCCSAVKQLLTGDVEGGVALEAVQLVADLVKNRKCDCLPDVVRTLSVLAFTEVKRDKEEGGDKKVKEKAIKIKKPGKKAAAAAKLGSPGMPTAAIEALKAKAASSRSIAKDVEREYKEADAGPDARLRASRQSKMLEALFEIYFRVIKHCTSSGLLHSEEDGSHNSTQGRPDSATASSTMSPGHTASTLGWSREKLLRKFPLLNPSLEGLARYTHLISVEYFNDIMEVFKQLLQGAVLPLIERLKVLLTASDILRGQGEALNVDRKEFYVQLYNTLNLIPYSQVLEPPMQGVYGEGETEADDPKLSQVLTPELMSGQQGLASMLASTLQQMLCDAKISDTARVAAFLKRSATVMAFCGSSEAMVILGTLLRMLRRYPRLLNMLQYEGDAPTGGRSFDPGCSDPSEAGAMASSLWELAFMTHHYHPHVAQAAGSLLAMGSKSGNTSQLSGPLAMAGTTKDLAEAYNIAMGAFRPAPPMPRAKRQALPVSMIRRLQLAEGKTSLTGGLKDIVKSIQVEDKKAGGLFEDHFRVLQVFEKNKEMRREKMLLIEKVKKFNQHLANKCI
ncbi:hypothetical protein CEUSTIGMA_g7247.t1 [Chlamydomonas eustigma]|uniref:Nucleolar complex protein 3 homolog n=1 Tax=Chlamydomonas eustigma TaxID=1157962 RepID=A0A250X9R6_9CHLO|nr:hypothetical protein CEUSTIGMA_g7247.t1 [Chlamydomonas eustigma]|eukprot:GAX79807.1 hypothetical protein CEUSTIGMA_g7247.t1 [Chlamydomonas eustigma]